MTEAADFLPDNTTAVRQALIDWYTANCRDYPWRNTTDPYEILVAEVMSQQTQLDRIVDAWHDFLDTWPTVDDLAAAAVGDVVSFWTRHSLGYNNRARYLHQAAQEIVTDYNGRFPRSPDDLQNLMGVGPYTANAVASFAFNNGDAVVDTNVRRVLYRVLPNVRNMDDPPYEAIATALMPEHKSRIWNNAIMELGGVACQPTPTCDEMSCPWRTWCHAYQTGDFTAPDVPTQPPFEGSRRQFRGRIIRTLDAHGELPLTELGPKIRVDYTPTGDHGRQWLEGLVADLHEDGLIDTIETDGDDMMVCLHTDG